MRLAASVWNSSHVVFVLRGFPGLASLHARLLLALPLAVCYALALLGNGSLLLALGRERRRLRGPMYRLIGALCAVDLLASTAVLPTTLTGLLTDGTRVPLAGCLAQMFLTHFLSSVESTLLLAMALDRYAAVCRPLSYASVSSGPRAPLALAVFTLVRSGVVMAVLVALAGSLRFCRSNVIQHAYCDHMALVRLACGSTARNRAAGLAVIACFVGVDIPVIAFSYGSVLRAVLRVRVRSNSNPNPNPNPGRLKALHTCGTHLMVILCFYLVGSVSFLSHNLNIPLSTDLNSLMGALYILLPAAVNPAIYGARTKEIRSGLLGLINLRAKKTRTVRVSVAGKGQTWPTSV
ncbi:olfactory receptor 52L1-like [Menidia menidia]